GSEHGSVRKASRDIEPIAGPLRTQVLCGLGISWPLPRPVEADADEIVMPGIRQHNAAAADIPSEKFLDLVGRGRPQALAFDDLCRDARAMDELMAVLIG